MRSRIKDNDGAPEFDQEDLTPERCDEILTEVAQLSVDFGFAVTNIRNAIAAKLYPPSDDDKT